MLNYIFFLIVSGNGSEANLLEGMCDNVLPRYITGIMGTPARVEAIWGQSVARKSAVSMDGLIMC